MSIESVIPSSHPHPLLSPSPPAFNLCQHQDLSNELALRIRWPKSALASVLPMNIQGWIPLGLTGLISLIKLLRVFSNTILQKHQFFSAQPSFWSNSQIHTWLLENPYLWLYAPLLAKKYLCFLIHCLILLLNPGTGQMLSFLNSANCVFGLYLQGRGKWRNNPVIWRFQSHRDLTACCIKSHFLMLKRPTFPQALLNKSFSLQTSWSADF